MIGEKVSEVPIINVRNPVKRMIEFKNEQMQQLPDGDKQLIIHVLQKRPVRLIFLI